MINTCQTIVVLYLRCVLEIDTSTIKTQTKPWKLFWLKIKICCFRQKCCLLKLYNICTVHKHNWTYSKLFLHLHKGNYIDIIITAVFFFFAQSYFRYVIKAKIVNRNCICAEYVNWSATFRVLKLNFQNQKLY